MLGRLLLCLMLVFALSSVSFAGGGVAVAVPSCNNCVNGGVSLAAPVQSYQVPVAVAVPVQVRQQYVQVQAVQQQVAVPVQAQHLKQVDVPVAVPVAVPVKNVGNRNQGNFRTPFRNGVKAFRDSLR